jgi:hypothetical protein
MPFVFSGGIVGQSIGETIQLFDGLE